MPWAYLSASVVGSSHAERGIPCQDASLCVQVSDDILVLVAADGAGTAAHSDEGSRIACGSVLEAIATRLANGGRFDILEEHAHDPWIEHVVSRLQIQAKARDVAVRELACTLLVAVLTPSASHVIQIGDGAIVGDRGDGLAPVMWPDQGEYANTTYFITDDEAISRIRVELNGAPLRAIALFTDGLQGLALNFADRTVHQPFFHGFFAHLSKEPPGGSVRLAALLEEYLASQAVNARTDDDKSLVLAVRLEP